MKPLRTVVLFFIAGTLIAAYSVITQTETDLTELLTESSGLIFTDLAKLDHKSISLTNSNNRTGCKGFIKGRDKTAMCSGVLIAEITADGQILFQGKQVGQWEERLVLTFNQDSYKLQAYSSTEEFVEIARAVIY